MSYTALVFLYTQDAIRANTNNDDKCASLYNFDIGGEKLSKLANCPDGLLVGATGDGLCVNYWTGFFNQRFCTNAFIYSFKSQQPHNIKLDGVPSLTCIVDGHVYFVLQGYNFESQGFYLLTNGGYAAKQIVDYNIAQNTLRAVKLPGASQWANVDYDGIHQPFGQTDVLHFHYNAFGNRLTEGRDYPEGIYRLDVQAGTIDFVLSTPISDYDRDFRKAYDGREIVLLGEDDAQHGYQLLSTEGDPPDMVTTFLEPGKYKVLHSFSKSFSRRDDYSLHGMSPDRHYALVLKTHADESLSTDCIYSYYLVDVINGNTRLILNDATGVRSKNYIRSSVYWVE